MQRKGLVLGLVSMLVFASAVPGLATDNPFPDLSPDHWAYDAVTGLAAAGLVEGYPNGTFAGDRIMTRYEAVMVFARILERMEALLKEEAERAVESKLPELHNRVSRAATEATRALAVAIQAESRLGAAEKSALEAQAIAGRAADLAGVADVKADAAQQSARLTTEEALRTARGAEEATVEGLLDHDAVEAIVASLLQEELEDVRANAAQLAKRVDGVEGRAISAAEAQAIAERVVADKLVGALGRVSSLEDAGAVVSGDVAAAKRLLEEKSDSLRSDLVRLDAEFRNELDALTAGQSAHAGEIARLSGDLEAQEIAIKKLGAEVRTGLGLLAGDLATIQGDLESNKRGLDATHARVETVQSDLMVTRGDVARLQRDVAAESAELASIKGKLAVTNINFGTELVVSDVVGNSVYNDPRATYAPDRERAAQSRWYDDRVFIKDEAFLRNSMKLATQPVPGAELSGEVFAKRSIRKPGIEAGIDIDLVTTGVLRSLHVGELQSDKAVVGFTNYVLNGAKWDAQLWRVNGVQALMQANGGTSINIVAGQGDVKRVDVTTGDDVAGAGAGDDRGDLVAASLHVPFNPLLEMTANWLHLAVDPASPVPASLSVGALEVIGENKDEDEKGISYRASVAGIRDKGAKAGDIAITQLLRNDVHWTAEYGYRGPQWKQRLAQPLLDGMALEWERFFGLQIGGLKPLGFDTQLIHRYTLNNAGEHPVWMIRGQRELAVATLPIQAVLEIGSNASTSLGGKPLSHSMIDLTLEDIAPFSESLSFTGGCRFERTPLQAEDWHVRWRNGNVAGAAGVAADRHNWVPDTTRAASHLRANWRLLPNTVVYAGGRWVTDSPRAALTSPPKQTLNVGLNTQFSLFGTDLNVGYEVEDTGIAPGKHSLDLAIDRAAGEGRITAGVQLSQGQGVDRSEGTGSGGKLALRLPVYHGADFHLDATYLRSVASSADDYSHVGLRAGIAVEF